MLCVFVDMDECFLNLVKGKSQNKNIAIISKFGMKAIFYQFC